MSWVRRPVGVPRGLVVAGLLVLAASWTQGLRMARDRQDTLRPRRIVATIPAGVADPVPVVRHSPGDLLLVRFPGAGEDRVGLYQILPERTLVRWIEDGRGSTDLVVPLAGLSPGRYAITRHGDDATATVRDMDRPPEELEILARFELSIP